MKIFSSPDENMNIEIEKDQTKTASDMPEMHSHPCHELYFLLSGERRYFIGHTIYDVHPGNVIIVPKNELHRTTVRNNQGYERYVVYFSDSCISELATLLGKNSLDILFKSGCFMLPSATINTLKEKLNIMYSEASRRDSYSEAMQRSILCEILILLMRYGIKTECSCVTHSDKIQEIARHICENYHENITLSDAAKMAYMEETYFSKRFKRLTGFGFCEYLTQIRVKASIKLLAHSDFSISEISEKCGFSSSNYYGDVFKRLNGISPSEYRKKLRSV